jgi:hypothetical protein
MRFSESPVNSSAFQMLGVSEGVDRHRFIG